MSLNNGSSDVKDVVERVPVIKPPFEISDLKKAIPVGCYERSLTRSLYFLGRDLLSCIGLYLLASNYIHLLPKPLNYVAWPIYWFCQGSVFFGLWAIGHDMSHDSFSEYKWVNDGLGLFLYSFLFNPYFSFKYSHRSHHAHTASMENDEIWVPKRKADTFFSEDLNNPLGNLFYMCLRLLIGIPLYYTLNSHGRKYQGFACHFYPPSPIFNDSERKMIWLSDAGLLVVCYALYKAAVTMGASWLFFMYAAPLIVMNAHFLIFTFMNHVHPAMPHYDSTEWDWLRGALSTVDRNFGILNDVFHNSTCCHVVHHLFTRIPHYHLKEATNAIKPILGEYYMYDGTQILKAFWRDSTACIYVEPDAGKSSGVYWYRK